MDFESIASKITSRVLSLTALGIGAMSSTLLRFWGGSYLTTLISGLLLLVSINILITYRRDFEHYLLAATYLAVVLVYAIAKYADATTLYLDSVDLALVAILLISAGYYWPLVDAPYLMKTHTPLSIIASTLLGLHLGLKYPLRLALLTLLENTAFSITSSTRRSRLESTLVVALFFTALYASPILVDAGNEAVAFFTIPTVVRGFLVLSSRFGSYRHRLADLVSLDIAFKPILVALI